MSAKRGKKVLALSILIVGLFSSSVGMGASAGEGIDALRARIVAFPSGSDDILLFGSNDLLPDLFLPLWKEGRVKSLTVVVPAEAAFTEVDLSSWKSYAGAIAPGSDNDFILVGGGLAGSIRGLAVRVVPLRAWKDGPPKGPVVLDLAFLIAMFKDETRTPFVELPRKFLAALDERRIDPSRLVPWVEDRQRIPLEYGYLPKLVDAMAGDPKAFREGLPAKWQTLRMGEHLAYLAMYEQAIAHFEGYLKEEPEDPAILFRIAFTYFVDRETERGLRFLHRAHRSDPSYIRGYAASAFTLFGKGELESAERIIRAGLYLDHGFLDLKVGLARILLVQARKILQKNPVAAEERFSEIASIGLAEELLAPLRLEWEEAKKKPAAPEVPSQGMPHSHPPGR